MIFYQDEEEKETALRTIETFQEYAKEGLKIVTQVVPLKNFFPAEGYHKDYYAKNPSERYCQLIIEPKLEKVRKRFAELVNQNS